MRSLALDLVARLLDPIVESLSSDVAGKLVKLKFDAKTQRKIDKLARKCNAGKLTEEEHREYGAYVQTIEFISILQAKARAILKRKPESA
jgi:hypothetical protein